MGKTILVVDDNAHIVQVVRHFLERAGYTVHSAQDGIAGLDIVSKEQIDLIVLDVMMPTLDGYHVCERLKSEEKTASIPVLFLSAKDQPADHMRGFMAGANDYIGKPFSSAELLDKVTEILERKRE
ncbi:MAG: response regulator [Planctomycetota bacterium]|nr:response regulator [Planctomycetota bacterium]